MLTVTQEQIKALRDCQLDMAARGIVAQLRLAHPALCAGLDDGAMLRSVQASIRKALALGLPYRRDFRIFAFLHLFVDRRFETRPAARKILTSRHIAPADRVGVYLRKAQPLAAARGLR